ncbi:hypothetical protein GEV27_02035 [Aeromicrobium sp. S22]|uniref:hypothetical protein n=1 Tax=Aeromicrobium sp. S22 TaxID=2662029 RepID=UPI00129E8258|nr:hypothetical protein [Aeromicrobium sp. S22]MRK00292.1 hypothetical protein [Aeromicrobium sp. S22]
MRRWSAVVLMCLLTMTACGDEEEKDMDGRSIDNVAQEARAFIDELAAAVGTDPAVQQDTITDCVPGQPDSGKDLIYNVRVSVGPGALQRVLDDVAPISRPRGGTSAGGATARWSSARTTSRWARRSSRTRAWRL